MKRVLLFIILLTAIVIPQELAWKRVFPGTSSYLVDVAVDTKDNVIVALGDTALKSLLIKFSPDGESLWARELHLPGGDAPLMVATDPDDNIIVGRSHDKILRVMKLTPNGDSLWTWCAQVNFGLSGIAANSSGCIVGAGDNEYMCLTFQITPDGQTEWMATIEDTAIGDFQWVGGLCTDSADNVIVGGCHGNMLYFPRILKYSQDGELLSEIDYKGPFNGISGGKPAADRWGNIYFPGCAYNGPLWHGSFLVKYDPDGHILWEWFSETLSDKWLRFCECVIDPTTGNIYAVGSELFGGGSPLWIELVRFPPTGDTALRFFYVLRENGQGCLITWVMLAIDSKGDVIAATKVGTGNPVNDTGYVLKFTNWPLFGITEPKHPGHPERSEAISSGFSLPTVIHASKPIAVNLPPETNIEVYDKTGRLVNREQGDRLSLSSGVYFIKASGEEKSEVKKVLLVK